VSDTGFYTDGEFGDAAIDALGTDLIPSSTGEALGAAAGGAVAAGITSRLMRALRGPDQAMLPRSSILTKEQANETFGIPGRLAFDGDTSIQSARDLYEHHKAQAARDDVLRRNETTGGFTRFAAGLAGSVIDPIGVAATFVPFLGEARIAGMLGEAAAGFGGRLAVRAAEGAGAGALGTAILEPAQYFLSQRDHDDYTMGDALFNIAVGTGLGSVLHGVLGAVRDRGGLPDWSPEVQAIKANHDAAVQQTTAALVEGRPVQAADAIEFAGAQKARGEIESWVGSVGDIEARANAALDATQGASNIKAMAAQRLDDIRGQLEKVRAEIDFAKLRHAEAAGDPTAQRLQAIDDELAKTIPAARRAALESERVLVTQGDSIDPLLEMGRTQAEITGLSKVEGRLKSKEALAARALEKAYARVAKADNAFDQAAKALAAREALVVELTARSLRKFAGRLGVALPDNEAADLASRITRAPPDRAAAEMRAALDTISNKPQDFAPYTPPDVIVTPGARAAANTIQAIRDSETQAGNRLAAGLRGEPTAADIAADRRAAESVERAPKVEGDLEKQHAELEKLKADTERLLTQLDKQEADRIVAAGGEAPKPNAELEAINAEVQNAAALARAAEAAATCLIGRL
jgi:hypothetical protein